MGNKLEQALTLNLDQEILENEQQMANEPAHRFSARYKMKKKRILQWADKSFDSYNRVSDYRRFRLRRVAVLAAAVVITLAAASTVIAIVKPEIFFIVKEKVTNWTITFDDDNSQETAFTYIKPPVPEDFQLVDETKGADYYYLTYQSEMGQKISYDQNDPHSVSISIDSEQSTPEKENIGETEVIIWERDDSVQIIYTDERYTYAISGNCGKEILFDIVRRMIER